MNTPQAHFVGDVRQIIQTACTQAVRGVDFARVQMYWRIGRRIVEEEQGGQARADYGKRVIRNLAEALQPEYGSGFGVRQMETSRQFYLLYPNAHTLCAQLNWSELFAAAKHNALLKYVEEQNAKGQDLRGGVIIRPEGKDYWLYSSRFIENTTELGGWDMFDPDNA